VIPVAHQNPVAGLFLTVALQAEVRIAGLQHFWVHRAVGRMAGHASLTEGFVLKYERSSLGIVAIEAGVIGRQGPKPGMGYRSAFMWIVAIGTRDLSFDYRMAAGQAELTLLVNVAIEANLRRVSRIDNGFHCATRFNVKAPRTMA